MEIELMKLYKCLTIKDLQYLYEQDDYFINKITPTFCRRFTKLLSFIAYDVINNNKDVYINKRKNSTHFYLKEIGYKDIIGLRKINMIKDLDIVMHKNFYLMYCGYTHGDVKHERGAFSFATLKRMTERVHNNEKILPLEEQYCIDYYIIMNYLFDINEQEYEEFLSIVDYLLQFLIKNKYKCFFKVVHLNMNTYLSITTSTIFESRTDTYLRTTIIKAKAYYKHREKNNKNYYYFKVSDEDYKKYYIDGRFTKKTDVSILVYKYLEEAVIKHINCHFFVTKFENPPRGRKFRAQFADDQPVQYLFFREIHGFNLPKKIIINE